MSFVIFSYMHATLRMHPTLRMHATLREHATLNPALSVHRLVNLSNFFIDFIHFIFLTLLLLPRRSGDLKYSPCLPARAWGSRYPALFKKKPNTRQDSRGRLS